MKSVSFLLTGSAARTRSGGVSVRSVVPGVEELAARLDDAAAVGSA